MRDPAFGSNTELAACTGGLITPHVAVWTGGDGHGSNCHAGEAHREWAGNRDWGGWLSTESVNLALFFGHAHQRFLARVLFLTPKMPNHNTLV